MRICHLRSHVQIPSMPIHSGLMYWVGWWLHLRVFVFQLLRFIICAWLKEHSERFERLIYFLFELKFDDFILKRLKYCITPERDRKLKTIAKSKAKFIQSDIETLEMCKG